MDKGQVIRDNEKRKRDKGTPPMGLQAPKEYQNSPNSQK